MPAGRIAIVAAVAVFACELSAQSVLDQIRIENPPPPPPVVQDVVNTVKKAADDTVNTVKKAADDTANTVKKAVDDTAKEAQILGQNIDTETKPIQKELAVFGGNIERETKPLRDEIAKGWGNINNEGGKALDAIDEFLKKAEAEFCDVMTLGGSKSGDATCSVNAGAGANDKGEVKGFNPTTGEDYGGKTIDEVIVMLGDANMFLPEYQEFEYGDVSARFLPGTARLGSPLSPSSVMAPTGSGVIRGWDGYKYSSGGFLSTRDNKTRFHGGVDYVTKPGEQIVAPMTGTIRVIGAIYKTENRGLTGVEIWNQTHRVSVFYVTPNAGIKNGVTVQKGMPIGTSQDLHVKYDARMTNHVHVQIIDNQGRRVDPSGKLVILPKPK